MQGDHHKSFQNVQTRLSRQVGDSEGHKLQQTFTVLTTVFPCVPTLHDFSCWADLEAPHHQFAILPMW